MKLFVLDGVFRKFLGFNFFLKTVEKLIKTFVDNPFPPRTIDITVEKFAKSENNY